LRANFEDGIYGNGLLLGDSAYPSKQYLVTPLLNPRTAAERHYNESHIRTRNIIERLFGIWKRRFPILALGMRYHLCRIMPIIVATAVLHNITRRNNDAVPDVDPELDLPVPWDNILAACNVINNRIDNDEINGGAIRTEIIHNYFAKYVSISFYIKVMALVDRTRQSGKAATRQRGGQSLSYFLMVPCWSH